MNSFGILFAMENKHPLGHKIQRNVNDSDMRLPKKMPLPLIQAFSENPYVAADSVLHKEAKRFV